jgi:hypothetical protein
LRRALVFGCGGVQPPIPNSGSLGTTTKLSPIFGHCIVGSNPTPSATVTKIPILPETGCPPKTHSGGVLATTSGPRGRPAHRFCSLTGRFSPGPCTNPARYGVYGLCLCRSYRKRSSKSSRCAKNRSTTSRASPGAGVSDCGLKSAPPDFLTLTEYLYWRQPQPFC